MRGPILKAGNDGRIRGAGGRGVGFAIRPAVEVGGSVTDLPGSLPVRVRFHGEGETFDVDTSEAYYRGRFDGFDVEGCEPGACYRVVVFESDKDGVFPGGKTEVLRQLRPLTAIPTAAPVGAVGVKVRPGFRKLTYHFSGVSQLLTVWAQTAGGTWFVAGELDTAGEPVATRDVWAPGGRVYLQAPVGGTSVEIDVTCEVG
ncbi:MAG: hypothetical protein ACK4N5_17120 [Myxococcales bacterium]